MSFPFFGLAMQGHVSVLFGANCHMSYKYNHQ